MTHGPIQSAWDTFPAIDGGRGATALPTGFAITHGACSSAHIVMKYHAVDTSIDNSPRWFNRLHTGRVTRPA